MNPQSHEPYAENAAAYAMNALDPEEARAFEEHLRGCAECPTTVAEMRSVLAMLPFAVELVEPPPQIKQQLMRQIRSASATDGAAADPSPQAAPTPQPTPPRGTFWASLSRGTFARGAALASLVLVLGMAALLVRQQRELDELRRVQAIVGSPRAVAESVRAGEIQAMIYAVPDSPTAYFVLDGLPRLPAGRDFQVWMLAEGGPVSVGVHHSEGSARWFITAPRPMREYDGVGVTQEPSGGSPAPTTQPILAHQFG